MLSKSKIGIGPTYIDLTKYPEKSSLIIFENLRVALETLQINAFVPYPLIIISTIKENSHIQEFKIVPQISELPQHFKEDVKSVKGKELALLNKISILAEKLVNQNLKKEMDNLHRIRDGQKQIFLNDSYIAFLNNILEVQIRSEELRHKNRFRTS